MFLLVNKPKGITSHDVVDKLRRVTGIRKIGHAGTLDPNATGLLILGIGRESTKKLGDLSKNTKKTYEAEIVLGEERDTDDAEGEIRDKIPHQLLTSQSSNSVRDDKSGFESFPDLSNINEVLKIFVGEQDQTPPAFSAIKVKGKKAYEMARKGKTIELEPRKITVYSIKLVNYKYPIINISCEVSSGTYIRSLARDIGRQLKTGAYLNNLKRTQIGKYSLEDATDLDKFTRDNWQVYCLE